MDDSNRNSALDADELNFVERRLAAWRPSAGELDRDRVLYEAGYAAGRAACRMGVWRLATSALVFISLGLSGMVAHERLLLMRERSMPLEIEVGRIATTGGRSVPFSPQRARSEEAAHVEPFATSSYFALSSRIAKGNYDLSSPDNAIVPQPRRPAVAPTERPTLRMPLQADDVRRVLDL